MVFIRQGISAMGANADSDHDEDEVAGLVKILDKKDFARITRGLDMATGS